MGKKKASVITSEAQDGFDGQFNSWQPNPNIRPCSARATRAKEAARKALNELAHRVEYGEATHRSVDQLCIACASAQDTWRDEFGKTDYDGPGGPAPSYPETWPWLGIRLGKQLCQRKPSKRS